MQLFSTHKLGEIGSIFEAHLTLSHSARVSRFSCHILIKSVWIHNLWSLTFSVMCRSWPAGCLMTTLCCRGRSLRRFTDASGLRSSWTTKVSLKGQRYSKASTCSSTSRKVPRQRGVFSHCSPRCPAILNRTASWWTPSWRYKWKYLRPRASSTKSSIPVKPWGRVACCSARGRRRSSSGCKTLRSSCSWSAAARPRCRLWMLHEV